MLFKRLGSVKAAFYKNIKNMRNIINISLPEDMVEMVKQETKKGSYTSVSEFFRSLLRDYKKENLILRELEESRREAVSGKGKVLKSLKDLR